LQASKIKHVGQVASGVALLLGALSALSAFAYEPDPTLMTIQGHSPEMVRFTHVQKNRQEWQAPPPPSLTPKQRLFKNFLYNNWLGSMDEFGYEIVRDN
jgi:hypothetical protein